MKQLGIILNNLGNNQLAFFTILNAQKLISSGIDVCLFYEENTTAMELIDTEQVYTIVLD